MPNECMSACINQEGICALALPKRKGFGAFKGNSKTLNLGQMHAYMDVDLWASHI